MMPTSKGCMHKHFPCPCKPVRTRLDEIVEEEGALPRIFAKRIAERAFRHGVERAVTTYTGWLYPNMPGHVTMTSAVQPGPAEEKNIRPDGLPVGFICKHGYSQCCRDDRRKGERRKVVHFGFGIDYFYPDGPDTYRRDRRSGSDRRKK